jgi:glycosyltransferase involved in cell wall biosynthesis
MPKVSIVFPVYNVENYVANSLGTLQDQTVEDIEIICVIDGSTDRSADIVKGFAADPRIRIIEQENRGLGEIGRASCRERVS